MLLIDFGIAKRAILVVDVMKFIKYIYHLYVKTNHIGFISGIYRDLKGILPYEQALASFSYFVDTTYDLV